MASTYDYFKQQVAQMERIKAQTAHEEHILEFRAMCADMINQMAPEIKRECMEECKQEIGMLSRGHSDNFLIDIIDFHSYNKLDHDLESEE